MCDSTNYTIVHDYANQTCKTYNCITDTMQFDICKVKLILRSKYQSPFLLRPQSSTTIFRRRLKFSPSFYHETDAYHSESFTPLSVFIATNSHWSIKLFSALPGCCPLRRTPFSNVIRMRTRSLVPKPKTTVIGLGARLVHTWNRESVSTVYGWHGLFS